jgi:NADH-ubiquinone oxidoreductase chain 1
MCILSSALFIGGYLTPFSFMYLYDTINYIWNYIFNVELISYYEYNTGNILLNSSINGLLYSLSLGLKSAIIVFTFIWVRASFPRIRFDQLISFCWTILLPIVFSFIILIPCLLYDFNIFIVNVDLF